MKLAHVSTTMSNKPMEHHELHHQNVPSDSCTVRESFLNDTLLHCVYHPRRREVDIREYFDRMLPELESRVQNQVERNRAVRWYVKLQIEFTRANSDERPTPGFIGPMITSMLVSNVQHMRTLFKQY
jgi:hypothetical protein